MQPGETITITITGNVKSGKTTIGRIITEALRVAGLRVKCDSESMSAGISGTTHLQQVTKLVDLQTRVEVNEDLPAASPSSHSHIEAKVVLRPDGTYTINRTL